MAHAKVEPRKSFFSGFEVDVPQVCCMFTLEFDLQLKHYSIQHLTHLSLVHTVVTS